MLTLYGVWQWVHEEVGDRSAGAIEHARSLYRFEQRIHGSPADRPKDGRKV